MTDSVLLISEIKLGWKEGSEVVQMVHVAVTCVTLLCTTYYLLQIAPPAPADAAGCFAKVGGNVLAGDAVEGI